MTSRDDTWFGPLEVPESRMKATATPEFIGHCITRVGAHMERAENSTDERVWKKHLEFASTYAEILRALN
jgi:hypothetical protein